MQLIMTNKSADLNTTRSTQDHLDTTMFQTPVFILFETLVVILSIAIVSGSSLVIHHIAKIQCKRYRPDFIFIILSVSDIIVGLIDVPICGIYWWVIIKIKRTIPIVNNMRTFFGDFPYYFSCLITVLIAVDRLLVIIFNQKYKNLIKPKILKSVVITLFLLTVTYSSLCVYFMKPSNQNRKILELLSRGYYILGLTSVAVIIIAYLCMLHIYWKNTSLKGLGKRSTKKHTGKRLTKTIIYICISQFVCILPYSIFWLTTATFKLQINAAPWIHLLRNCQCLFNAIILLCNLKKRRILKHSQADINLIISKSTSGTKPLLL